MTNPEEQLPEVKIVKIEPQSIKKMWERLENEEASKPGARIRRGFEVARRSVGQSVDGWRKGLSMLKKSNRAREIE